MTKTLTGVQKTNQAPYKVYIIHVMAMVPRYSITGFHGLSSNWSNKALRYRCCHYLISEHPVKPAWAECLAQFIGQLDQHTFFVAHSLGCITLLDYLPYRMTPWCRMI